MSIIIVIVAVAVAVVLYGVLTFNSLIHHRNDCHERFANIETQLKRRHDLIPSLVETVKGYAMHEREVFENVTTARSAAAAATGPDAQGAAENALSGALRQLFAVAEAYPDLKANENFLELQSDLTDTEDKVQLARSSYNAAVREMNIKVQSFPSRIIATMFNIAKREFFELEDASAREVPSVSIQAPSAPSAG